MTDYTELKRLAENHLSLGQAYTVAKPSVLLALIAENERLESESVYSAAGFDAARDEITRLKAENESLHGLLREMRSIGNHAPAELTLRVDAALGKGEQP